MEPAAFGLPHREPFLFIDRVVSTDPSGKASCERTFREAEDFFRGHFPGEPVVPGVLLAEALAQAAGIAGAAMPGAPRSFRLSAIRSMKFPAPARPGETVLLRAEFAGAMGGLYRFDVEAGIGSTSVAEGCVVLNGI